MSGRRRQREEIREQIKFQGGQRQSREDYGGKQRINSAGKSPENH